MKSPKPSSRVRKGWDAFCRKHATWLGCAGEGKPVYTLPERVIAKLATARVLDRQAKKAELRLYGLCKRERVIGFLDGQGIANNLFFHHLPSPSRTDVECADGSRVQTLEAERLVRIPGRYLERLRGVAGWLLTEPEFLRDCETLEHEWRSLADDFRPRFPLRYDKFRLEILHNQTAEMGSAEYTKFASAFVAFCDRWGLIGMQTWDPPEPQGILFLNPSPEIRRPGYTLESISLCRSSSQFKAMMIL